MITLYCLHGRHHNDNIRLGISEDVAPRIEVDRHITLGSTHTLAWSCCEDATLVQRGRVFDVACLSQVLVAHHTKDPVFLSFMGVKYGSMQTDVFIHRNSLMRRCLLEPIHEHHLAAELLRQAADALLQQRVALAAELLVSADFSVIREHTVRVVGAMSVEIHRQINRPKGLPKEERDPMRMPSLTDQNLIFERDGWRCRFCAVKVISRKARGVFVRSFPKETRWGGKEFDRHAALYSMAVSLDHVLPHSRGGGNEVSNFVTACYCCQFGRGEWTLEESELFDPRDYEPVVDDWDGLTRLDGFRA